MKVREICEQAPRDESVESVADFVRTELFIDQAGGYGPGDGLEHRRPVAEVLPTQFSLARAAGWPGQDPRVGGIALGRRAVKAIVIANRLAGRDDPPGPRPVEAAGYTLS